MDTFICTEHTQSEVFEILDYLMHRCQMNQNGDYVATIPVADLMKETFYHDGKYIREYIEWELQSETKRKIQKMIVFSSVALEGSEYVFVFNKKFWDKVNNEMSNE